MEIHEDSAKEDEIAFRGIFFMEYSSARMASIAIVHDSASLVYVKASDRYQVRIQRAYSRMIDLIASFVSSILLPAGSASNRRPKRGNARRYDK